MKRRRAQSDTESAPGSPLWMTTYSDMVTLLLAFFVLLFSLSSIDAKKFEQVVIAMRGALGVLEGSPSSSPDNLLDTSGMMEALGDHFARDLQQLGQVEADLRRTLDRLGLEQSVSLSYDERGLVVRFLEGILFDTGRADLRPDALPVLEELAATLAGLPNHIRVEGHTDNVPIRTVRFPSNWDLSVNRATTVVRYFLEHHEGFSPKRLSAAGYGEFRPIADNETPQGRQQNRRVDIVVLYISETSMEPR